MLLGRSQSVPGTLRHAIGTPLERSECLKVDCLPILRAPNTSREGFLATYKIDSGIMCGMFWRQKRTGLQADFCVWWAFHKDRLTDRARTGNRQFLPFSICSLIKHADAHRSTGTMSHDSCSLETVPSILSVLRSFFRPRARLFAHRFLL